MRRALLAAAALGVATACRPVPAEPGDDAQASPQASAVPAPLAAAPPAPASAAAQRVAEGGTPAVPLRTDLPLGSDPLARETVGYTLSAAFRQAELTGPQRAPEVNAAGVDAARKKTELRLAIDLTPSRMRVVLQGAGFVLPAETEIRARADRHGHVVVWPGGASYRPLAPGGMRALLGERRFDVAPIAPAEITPKDEQGKRIGIRAHKVEVATRAANATFEVGRLPDLGEGGVLLCRLLLDLMNAPPAAPVCGVDELPLRAELRWVEHGAFSFELTGVLRRADAPAAPLAVPPSGATFGDAPAPAGSVVPMLSVAELGALRTGPSEIPPGPFAEGEGLLVVNGTDQLRVLVLDGVPVAWAAPGARDLLRGLPRGRYAAQWRTFLGDAVEAPVTQSVPGLAQLGGGDAGLR